MSYGKVKDSFWTDKKIRAFSDDAKMLALYLMTGPHRNIIGCMRVPNGYIMEDLGWSAKRLSDAIAMLSERQFICRDEDGWTLILNQLRHDPLTGNKNHITAATRLANEVPRESHVFQALFPRLMASLNAIGMASAWQVDAIEIPEPLPEPEPEPLPEPEPEKVTSPAATTPSAPPQIDLALEAYNASADRVGWPMAQVLNERRKRGLTARLAECGGLSGWMLALEKAEASDFLTGRAGRTSGHSNWTPNIDFFLQQSSFLKLMEGTYDNRNSAPSKTEWQRTLDRIGEFVDSCDQQGASVS